MTPRRCGLLLLLVILFAGAVSAAEIRLSTGQTEYYFTVGEEAAVPVHAGNSYDHDIIGMLRTTVSGEIASQGAGIRSSSAQEKSFGVRKGESDFTIGAGTSETPATLLLDIAFDYTDGAPVSISLGTIVVHFIPKEDQKLNEPSPLSSTSRQGNPGNTASPSGPGQQGGQASGQATPAAQGTGSGSPDLQKSQMPQDAVALQKQLSQEQQKDDLDRQKFLDLLHADPTFASVDDRLRSTGYTQDTIDVRTESGDTGTFSTSYNDPSGARSVAVSGAMENGAIRFVREESGPNLVIPPVFGSCGEFSDAVRQLAEEGYNRTATMINTTPADQSVSLTFLSAGGGTAYLKATAARGNVTKVSVERPPGPGDSPYATAGALVLILIIAAAMYWLAKRRNSSAEESTPAIGSPIVPDYGEEAQRILANAEEMFRSGRCREAYGQAARALRFYLSHCHGDGMESTNAEILALIAEKQLATAGVKKILDRCCEVEFARGIPDDGEFLQFVEEIRNRLGGKDGVGPINA